MAAVYLAAGANHFIKPEYYLKVMPPYLPFHEILNYVSGAAEIILAIMLCFPATRSLAAWGVIALLIAVFPANIYMFQARETVFSDLPAWALAARLPMQAVLALWAYWYT